MARASPTDDYNAAGNLHLKMRINIHVPEANVASSSKVDLSAMPAPLVRLAPSDELVLIELQGSLEIDDAEPEGGQVLAKLEFHPGREDRPMLLISHHRLEGKLVSLTKPLVVLERKTRAAADGPHGQDVVAQKSGGVMGDIDINRPEMVEHLANVPSSPTRFANEHDGLDKQSIPSLVADEDDDDDDDDDQAKDSPHNTPKASQTEEASGAPDSPTMARKRARVGQTVEHAALYAAHNLTVPSSSPVPARRMQGSELDYSSPLPAAKRRATNAKVQQRSTDDVLQTGKQDAGPDMEDEWLYKRDTATYLEVVCIIRKKFLFSKRPEPVVRLDGEGGEKAKAALGLA